MKIAVGYVRCSTDMQEGSIEQQKNAIEEWAKDHNFKIIEWFIDEGKSGTTFERRPAFTRLLKKIESSPNFEYILVYDESRWGRAADPKESPYWKYHFQRHGVKVHVINSQSRQENDIVSYILEGVEGAEASDYSKKLSRSTLRGCIDNASKGFSNGGTAPYGYRRVAVDNHTGEIIRSLSSGECRRKGEEKVVWDLGEDEEVKTVRLIFEMKCSGYGYRKISDSLNKKGTPCPKRGRWRNKNQMWSMGTIQSIITNPAYCGDRVYNRHPLSKKKVHDSNILGKTKKHWISTEDEWKVQHGAHPSIVSKEIFRKANDTRKITKRQNQHIYDSPYLLSGLVKCEHCGFNYQGQSRRSENIFYYIDGGNANKGRSVCGWSSIRKEKLEGGVLELIRKSLPTSKMVGRFEEMIAQFLSKRSNYDNELNGITRKIADTDKKITNILELVEKGGIEVSTVLFRLRELEKTKNGLEEEKRKVENIAGENIEIKRSAQMASDFALNFYEKFDNAPIQEKKQMIRQVVIGVRINPETRMATCGITKIPMVNRALMSLVNPPEFMNLALTTSAHCSGGRT